MSAASSVTNVDNIILLLLVLQGVWALFLIVLTWSIRRVLKDIEDNTKATNKVAESVSGISLLLAGNFVTKPDLTRLEDRFRIIENDVVILKDRNMRNPEGRGS